MKDDADLRATIVSMVPNTRVAAMVPLPSGPRAQTYRADVIADGRSQTWFIKHFQEPSGHATQEFNSHERLRGVVGVTPALIASDTQNRVLIVEYLTHALDLFVALQRSADPLNVMRELGRLTARLAAATHELPSFVDDVAIRECAVLAAAWPKVETWAAEFGVPATDGMATAVAAVLDRWAHPSKACLTQGDPAPSNVAFLPDGQARLVDFEYGAQRHVLADLVQWWIRCPLPEPWFEAMVDEVKMAFVDNGIYADADAFDDDLAHVATYAALYMFTWLPIKQTVAEDPPWVGAWRARHALLSSSSRGMRASRSAPALSALADWLDTLNAALSRAWPACGDGAPDWNALVGKSG